MNLTFSTFFFIIFVIFISLFFLFLNLDYNIEFNKTILKYSDELENITTKYTLANEMMQEYIYYFKNSRLAQIYLSLTNLEKISKIWFIYKMIKGVVFVILSLKARAIYKNKKYKNIL